MGGDGHPSGVEDTLEWVVPALPNIVVRTADEHQGELAVIAVFHGAQDR